MMDLALNNPQKLEQTSQNQIIAPVTMVNTNTIIWYQVFLPIIFKQFLFIDRWVINIFYFCVLGCTSE